MSDAPETITAAELAEALRHAGQFVDLSKGLRGLFEHGGEERLAASLVGYVSEHLREPESMPGRAYEDAEGVVFLRSEIRDWVDRSGGRWGDDIPLRPLRKLVPEGSQAAKADHGAILDEITQWTNLPRPDAVDLAWRICKLIGGECSGE